MYLFAGKRYGDVGLNITAARERTRSTKAQTNKVNAVPATL